ncbi:MAG: histidinol phosphate phosphatase [Rickettsiales bacterium]|nr:histidinol phosphate phosphatase [Rickettsiales bacterium]OUV54144.1 MAG: hypothetical protein CBC87_02375 [Rickettsiales bacterium TMED127]|tara:strand:+ start:42076 stop:42864 length:789 start_codon:yes stop_codon:yes gene_type:complete
MIESAYSKFHKFSHNFTNLSGEILRKEFYKAHNIDVKDDKSFVTDIDFKIEKLFLDMISKEFPSHGVLGEEFGNKNPHSEIKWIIDPLDGTNNFIAGKPIFGTLLSLVEKGKNVLGLIDIPILNERWSGASGLIVKKNNIIIEKKTENKALSECIVSSTSMLMFDEDHIETIRNIYDSSKFCVFGTDCYGYGLLISGKIDLIIEADLRPWDFMSHAYLVEEIGGIMTDWSGKKLDTNSDGKVIAARSKKSHEQALNLLSKLR